MPIAISRWRTFPKPCGSRRSSRGAWGPWLCFPCASQHKAGGQRAVSPWNRQPGLDRIQLAAPSRGGTAGAYGPGNRLAPCQQRNCQSWSKCRSPLPKPRTSGNCSCSDAYRQSGFPPRRPASRRNRQPRQQSANQQICKETRSFFLTGNKRAV